MRPRPTRPSRESLWRALVPSTAFFHSTVSEPWTLHIPFSDCSGRVVDPPDTGHGLSVGTHQDFIKTINKQKCFALGY